MVWKFHPSPIRWIVLGGQAPQRKRLVPAAALSLSVSLCEIIANLICRLVVNLDHFKLLRVVGKGAFGKVRIVERKDTGLTFALKYIRKDEGAP